MVDCVTRGGYYGLYVFSSGPVRGLVVDLAGASVFGGRNDRVWRKEREYSATGVTVSDGSRASCVYLYWRRR
jgi:hypothetical protein